MTLIGELWRSGQGAWGWCPGGEPPATASTDSALSQDPHTICKGSAYQDPCQGCACQGQPATHQAWSQEVLLPGLTPDRPRLWPLQACTVQVGMSYLLQEKSHNSFS